MGRLIATVIVILAASVCGPPTDVPAVQQAPGPSRLTAGWTVSEGMDAPESAYLDAGTGVIFVSLVTGQPTDRDGAGRIATLALNGAVINASWATGLNAPKGLRICQGTLWTADIDEVIGIGVNAGSGQITTRLKVQGAQFLNDVACGPDGTVYVSDMLASRIYAVRNGTASTFVEGETLEYPNGLLVDGNRLIVAGWGKPNPDFTTNVPGRLFAIDLTSRQKTLITPKPLGNLDGVESDGKGGFIVSDWMNGQIWQVHANGDSHSMWQFKPGAADLAFQPAGNILILPHMSENKVASYDLSDAVR
jgi:sugar lactone lactonase YvrE